MAATLVTVPPPVAQDQIYLGILVAVFVATVSALLLRVGNRNVVLFGGLSVMCLVGGYYVFRNQPGKLTIAQVPPPPPAVRWPEGAPVGTPDPESGFVAVDPNSAAAIRNGVVVPVSPYPDHDIGLPVEFNARYAVPAPPPHKVHFDDPNIDLNQRGLYGTAPWGDDPGGPQGPYVHSAFTNGDVLNQTGDYPDAAFDEPVDNLLFGEPDNNESLQPFNARVPPDGARRRQGASAVPHWDTHQLEQGHPEFNSVISASPNRGGTGPGPRAGHWRTSVWHESPLQQNERGRWINSSYGPADRVPDQDADPHGEHRSVDTFYKKDSNYALYKQIFNRYNTWDPYHNGAKTGYGQEQRKRIMQTTMTWKRDPYFIRNKPEVRDGAFHVNVDNPNDY